MDEFKNEIQAGKKIIWWFIGLIFLISIGGFVLSRACQIADNAVLHYEEFQEIYNTAEKLNQDLCVLNATPADDTMFEQFSKAQRLTGVRQTLNRWIAEYNAKSSMWNRNLWKSDALPYRLESARFNCY